MKIIFISNFLNHHQIPLCEEFRKMDGVEFSFFATTPVPAERQKMHYQSDFSAFPYRKEIGVDLTKEEAKSEILKSDVVIIGDACRCYVEERLWQRKLTFRYMERMFREGFWSHPGDIYRAFRKLHCPGGRSLYVLAAGWEVKKDCRRVFFSKRIRKWGYFPETRVYTDEEIRGKKNHDPIKLLWTGRMISWKHPEIFLHTCKGLRDRGIDFQADMIGEGEERSRAEQYIRDEKLIDRITIHNFMTPAEVRDYMEKSDVYFFTSDRNEGWGAVLNEAMNSGNAVIASEKPGSTGFLVQPNRNGLVYRNNSEEDCIRIALSLLEDREQTKDRDRIRDLSLAAKSTITETWNSRVAAERLYQTSLAILHHQPLPVYEDGPMSPA